MGKKIDLSKLSPDEAETILKARARRLKWIAANPEKDRAAKAKYSKANREKLKAKDDKWRRDNPEKIRGYRVVALAKNPDKNRARVAQWRSDNPEKIREYRVAYKDKALINQRKRQSENPEKFRAAASLWRSKNPEKFRAAASLWRSKNPEKVREAARAYNDTLSDACCRHRISKGTVIDIKMIPKEMIEIYRLSVLIRRELIKEPI